MATRGPPLPSPSPAASPGRGRGLCPTGSCIGRCPQGPGLGSESFPGGLGALSSFHTCAHACSAHELPCKYKNTCVHMNTLHVPARAPYRMHTCTPCGVHTHTQYPARTLTLQTCAHRYSCPCHPHTWHDACLHANTHAHTAHICTPTHSTLCAHVCVFTRCAHTCASTHAHTARTCTHMHIYAHPCACTRLAGDEGRVSLSSPPGLTRCLAPSRLTRTSGRPGSGTGLSVGAGSQARRGEAGKAGRTASPYDVTLRVPFGVHEENQH